MTNVALGYRERVNRELHQSKNSSDQPEEVADLCNKPALQLHDIVPEQ
jgi:hypothetical protein